MPFQVKTILFGLLGINALMFVLILTSTFTQKRELLSYQSEPTYIVSESEISPSKGSLPIKTPTFTDPALAYDILTLLDVANETYATSMYNPKRTEILGIANDDKYCEKHRAYFVEDPGSIFNEMNAVFDVTPSALMRARGFGKLGNDVHLEIGVHNGGKRKSQLKPYVNLFVTRKTLMLDHILGKHFSCLTQSSNHIPGTEILASKLAVSKAVKTYLKTYEDKPQCLKQDKFFPKTWLLDDKQECKEFFNKFNSPEYKQLKKEKTIVYLRKIEKVHMGAGVQPVTEEEEASLRSLYKNGEKCGMVRNGYILQNFIHNPLLIAGHKFDFRMFMFVASTNPLIAFWHDGFLRVSLIDYDVKSKDKKVLLTNVALNHDIYEGAKHGTYFNGMDEAQLKHAQQWTLARFPTYLLENGVVSDPNWLNNYLVPQFKKAMIHLLRMSADQLYKDSSIYQIYGADFMLDDNMNLWFIECNTAPGIGGFSTAVNENLASMVRDHFEIVFGLLRSRMKRIVKFVNELTESGQAKMTKGGLVIQNLEKVRKEFKFASRNHFEPEFEPRKENRWEKFIDENYSGKERYQGFLDVECY